VREPFDEYAQVTVNGGVLNVARAGPTPSAAAAVVLAVHGITSSHMAWRAVARELRVDSDVCVLAPDLRGRGRSATLPGPHGIKAHVLDLVAVLDDAGADRVLLAGHSMGAHVAARLAVEHPDRAAGVVALDGGVVVPQRLDVLDEQLETAATPAVDRMEVPASTADDYVARWRSHPAFASAWNDDVEAYVRYDMADDGDCARCVVSEDAVTADNFELMFDDATRTAMTRVQAPVRILHASRGLFDDHEPVLPPSSLEDFASARPRTRIERVKNVNHYTLLLGDGPGPGRVAAAIREAIHEHG
jgi:pimeloyl-ACP methyl ester carboxylesterase